MRWFDGRAFAKGFIAVCSAVMLSGLLVACGSSGGGSDGTASDIDPVTSAAVSASGCGAVATPAPKDPDGVLATLPASYQSQYAGYSSPVRKNPWADFKPKHGPPYKVGFSFGQLNNTDQIAIYNGVKKEFAKDPDMKMTAVSTGSSYNIPQQIQQLTALLNQDPDYLIVQPLSDAFGPVVEKAAKKGVPVLSIEGATTGTKYAFNMIGNNFGSGAVAASVVFRQMGGKGNTMFVHGIAGTTADADTLNSYKAGLKNCPNIKPAGEIAGGYVPATAKAETLKFLATHPEEIDGVIEVGGMAPGVISGFKQAGRPVPVVLDRGGEKASLGYWINNKDSYRGFAQGFPPLGFARAIHSVTARMLAGRGLQVSDITENYVPILEQDLDDWADTSWNLKTPGEAEGPPQSWLSEKYLSGLFKDPAPASQQP